MLIALTLVLVMMHQGSKPEIYESFFDALTAEKDLSGKDQVKNAAVETGSTAVSQQVDPIDPTVIAGVVDGTVWRSGDLEALLMYLNLAAQSTETSGPTVGVLPLLQQPEVFRNKTVRVQGRVARSERIEAATNRHGISGYWQLWVRPSEGVDRPLVVIVGSVPVEVAAVGSQATAGNGPNVVVTGRFLKRLAYRSSQGADLAPVIVGKLIKASPPRGEITNDLQSRTNDITQTRFWFWIAAASLAGVSLAAFAMWRTSVMAARTRQIRSLGQKVSDPFLQSLADEMSGNEQQRDGASS